MEDSTKACAINKIYAVFPYVCCSSYLKRYRGGGGLFSASTRRQDRNSLASFPARMPDPFLPGRTEGDRSLYHLLLWSHENTRRLTAISQINISPTLQTLVINYSLDFIPYIYNSILYNSCRSYHINLICSN